MNFTKAFKSTQRGSRPSVTQPHSATELKPPMAAVPAGPDLTPDEMIQLFDKHPSVAVQRKINYYFMPYNKHFDCAKHMRFDGDDILDQIH